MKVTFDMPSAPDIRIFGLGGAGLRVLSQLTTLPPLPNVQYWGVSADPIALAHGVEREDRRLLLGPDERGLACGANPELGRRAALDAVDAIRRSVAGADLVIMVGGFGRSSQGVGPVMADIAKKEGALVVGTLSLPARFEGTYRRARASSTGIGGLGAWLDSVDTLIVMPHDLMDAHDSFDNYYERLDIAMVHTIQAVIGGITAIDPGSQGQKARYYICGDPDHLVTADFADRCALLREGGLAVSASAESSSDKPVLEALRSTLANKVISTVGISRARRILLALEGDELPRSGVEEALDFLYGQIDSNAEIVLGAIRNPALPDGIIRATLVINDVSSLPQSERPEQSEEVAFFIDQLTQARENQLKEGAAQIRASTQPSLKERLGLSEPARFLELISEGQGQGHFRLIDSRGQPRDIFLKGRAHRLLMLLFKNRGDRVAPLPLETIAKKLRIGEPSVRSVIQRLRKHGVPLNNRRGIGYTLDIQCLDMTK